MGRHTALACEGERPKGPGRLVRGSGLRGVGRRVLCAGRAQPGPFCRPAGLPDGRHGGRLYQLRLVWLPFTYPPFAAVVFAALAVVPWKVAVTVLTGASVAALPAALYRVLRLPGPVREQARERAWTLALAVATAAIWLEPARATLGYGQVDILLTAAGLYDLSLPETPRGKGVMIGLAAGLKLAPASFPVYL